MNSIEYSPEELGAFSFKLEELPDFISSSVMLEPQGTTLSG
jgi:hypothetical protein